MNKKKILTPLARFDRTAREKKQTYAEAQKEETLRLMKLSRKKVI